MVSATNHVWVPAPDWPLAAPLTAGPEADHEAAGLVEAALAEAVVLVVVALAEAAVLVVVALAAEAAEAAEAAVPVVADEHAGLAAGWPKIPEITSVS